MTGVDGPRLADGSLPDLDFLKLSPDSDLIDAGVNVGLPYNGSAPDLGAFESGGVITGDLDGDGYVGLTDLDIILSNWNLTVPPGDIRADTSGNGHVGLQDLDTVLLNWNTGTPPSDASVIPEPTSAILMGLIGLALLKF